MWTVAGTNVLGVDRNGWTGTAAPAGGTIDQVNNALCPDTTPIPGGSLEACATILGAFGGSGPGFALAGGQLASGAVLLQQGNDTYGVGAVVAPSSAETNSSCEFYGGSHALAALLQVGYQAGAASTAGEQDITLVQADHSNDCS